MVSSQHQKKTLKEFPERGRIERKEMMTVTRMRMRMRMMWLICEKLKEKKENERTTEKKEWL